MIGKLSSKALNSFSYQMQYSMLHRVTIIMTRLCNRTIQDKLYTIHNEFNLCFFVSHVAKNKQAIMVNEELI